MELNKLPQNTQGKALFNQKPIDPPPPPKQFFSTSALTLPKPEILPTPNFQEGQKIIIKYNEKEGIISQIKEKEQLYYVQYLSLKPGEEKPGSWYKVQDLKLAEGEVAVEKKEKPEKNLRVQEKKTLLPTKKSQEALDEEFARNLQEEFNQETRPTNFYQPKPMYPPKVLPPLDFTGAIQNGETLKMSSPFSLPKAAKTVSPPKTPSSPINTPPPQHVLGIDEIPTRPISPDNWEENPGVSLFHEKIPFAPLSIFHTLQKEDPNKKMADLIAEIDKTREKEKAMELVIKASEFFNKNIDTLSEETQTAWAMCVSKF
ncbi:MAG: hypothetical protein WC860_04270 [Candidatus Margulisiibacteriota bacterium]|jgi:hypothetical protein